MSTKILIRCLNGLRAYRIADKFLKRQTVIDGSSCTSVGFYSESVRTAMHSLQFLCKKASCLTQHCILLWRLRCIEQQLRIQFRHHNPFTLLSSVLLFGASILFYNHSLVVATLSKSFGNVFFLFGWEWADYVKYYIEGGYKSYPELAHGLSLVSSASCFGVSLISCAHGVLGTQIERKHCKWWLDELHQDQADLINQIECCALDRVTPPSKHSSSSKRKSSL